MEWYEKWPYKQIGIADAEQIEIKANMSECCIAFIDILGFKTMVKNNIDNVILALRYIKMFRDSFYRFPSPARNDSLVEVNSEPDKEWYEGRDLPKATMFSDSIVISKEIDEYFSFSDFVEFIAQIQFELLREGLLLRGGIDIGQVYHDDSFIFGSGMISAYLLESKISKYPRITISKNAIEKVQSWDEVKFENKFRAYINNDNEKVFLYPQNLEDDFVNDEFIHIKEDEEEIAYIDYLYNGCRMIQASTEDIFVMDKYVCANFIEDTLAKIRKLISDGLTINDVGVLKKYEWMKQYFNNTIMQVIKTYKNRKIDVNEENEEIQGMLSELLFTEKMN